MRRPDLKELRSRVEVKCRKGYGRKRCWLWEGAMNNGITPTIDLAGSKVPAASIMVGDLGAEVHRTCGNGLCMKPSHLTTERSHRVDPEPDWRWAESPAMLNRLRIAAVRAASLKPGVEPDDVYSGACAWLALNPGCINRNGESDSARLACNQVAQAMVRESLDETSFEDWYDYEEGAF